jgi:hypothetical protein
MYCDDDDDDDDDQRSVFLWRIDNKSRALLPRGLLVPTLPTASSTSASSSTAATTSSTTSSTAPVPAAAQEAVHCMIAVGAYIWLGAGALEIWHASDRVREQVGHTLLLIVPLRASKCSLSRRLSMLAVALLVRVCVECVGWR